MSAGRTARGINRGISPALCGADAHLAALAAREIAARTFPLRQEASRHAAVWVQSCLTERIGRCGLVIVAGIDEAGLGPVLGPLVVSATAFAVPDELAEVSMWRLLAGSVTEKPSRRRGAVAIGDSKRLYASRSRAPERLEHLERGVLAALRVGVGTPSSVRELLGDVAPQAVDKMRHYPWYRDADLSIPCAVSETDAMLSGNSLKAAMKRAGVAPTGMMSEVIFAGEFNRIVSATRNKSTTLLDVSCRLLMDLWRNAPRDGRVRIVCDRQGGRMRYLPALQRVFDGCSLKVIDESDVLSAYRISDGRREAELVFAVGAERRHLPAALASMLSKYIRELFMTLFNRFWTRQLPDLSPTAGYYVDGRRFYSEIAPTVRRLGLSEQLLYRCR